MSGHVQCIPAPHWRTDSSGTLRFEQQFRVARTGLQSDITGAIIETMNTATKLLAAMRQNPNDWAMAKLLTVA
jgi:hypothetical protein